ncbi:hypothetical protein STIB_73210 [Streptomyces sp. IB2014 011-1]|nr:hypothetical protein STIB_73210 [Streptomyces sp. IB2014 011-1]
MTVTPAPEVIRGAGYAGWPLLPSPAVSISRPRIVAPPAAATEIDDLVALAAALNGGDRVVYIDNRPGHTS